MKTALLVIDPQKIYTTANSDMFCEDSAATIGRVNRLIENAQSRDQSIVFVRHVHKRDGSDLGRLFDFTGEAADDFDFKEGSPSVDYDSRLVRPDSVIEITKTRYSAFAATNLSDILRAHTITNVVICGFMTNFCCESTARDALDRDYYVDFVVDATGSPGTEHYDEEQIRTIVAELLSYGFANVYKTERYLKG